ncbi:MAG: Crp/Fnr family transcriptional regulator [Candidatus Acidiferrales bacterium]
MSTYPALSDLSLERLLGNRIMNAHTARQKGFVLFAEGQKVLGVHVLREGRVKLSIGSDNGKSLILGLVGRGTVLGLPEGILGLPHASTAEVVESAKLSFLSRDDLLRHLRATEKAAYTAAEVVSAICNALLAEIKLNQLSQSAEQKVARFLLERCPTRKSSKGQAQMILGASQEELGQMLGLSRETVARVVSRFKKRHILEPRTPTLVVHDRAALSKVAGFQEREKERTDG